MPSDYKWKSFKELVEECGGKKGAILADYFYDGDGAEFDLDDDEDAECCYCCD